MKCPVCGAKCVCRNATEMCCSCHKHKARARTSWAQLGREIAHGAVMQANDNQLELFPELSLTGVGDAK